MPRIGVVTFPGSLDEQDAARAARIAGAEAVSLWHGSETLTGLDALILPGGATYGGYLRPGALASLSPVVREVRVAAERGMPVLGIGDGFQVLCEAGILDGALLPNDNGRFLCANKRLRIESVDTVWTCGFTKGDEVVLPFKSANGNFQTDADTLKDLEGYDRVVLRWRDNPSGSVNNIAGITNTRGNVVGIMAHPEHAVDDLTGPSSDGNRFFESMLGFLSLRS